MRTTRLLTISCSIRWGVYPTTQSPPPDADPLDADLPGHRPSGCRLSLDADTPGCRPSLWMQTPPVDRMTDACGNITLPQTSFGGGNESAVSLSYWHVCLPFCLSIYSGQVPMWPLFMIPLVSHILHRTSRPTTNKATNVYKLVQYIYRQAVNWHSTKMPYSL